MAALVVITLVRADASAQTADRTTPELDSLPTLMDVAVERVGTAPTTGPGGAVTGEGNQNRRRPAVLSEKRVCDGCPSRRPGHALLQTTAVNVVYGLGNLARGQVTARVTPATWWANMEHSWVWDLDDFVVNQFGHPYQGSNYFNTGRDNGLSFWESSAVTAFGSATWEYFGETNRASLNDLINTTLGGIALGEMFHRAAWLVRRPETPGLGREIAAAAIDPLTGLNRFLSGDASRVTSKPAEMVSSSLGGLASAGVLWQGSERRAVQSTGKPFLEMDLLYGNMASGRSRTPYDAFFVRLRLGGGSAVSSARVRGRLVGRPLGDGPFQITVSQNYDFDKNEAYEFGAQAFEVNLGVTQQLSSRVSVQIVGGGGVTALGAVDSRPLVEPPAPVHAPSESGQGISEGPRTFDYGPGSNFAATVVFRYDGREFAVLSAEGRHLYVVDGVRANHLLQRFGVDLWRRCGVRSALASPASTSTAGPTSRTTPAHESGSTSRSSACF